jgi:chaperonin GroES
MANKTIEIDMHPLDDRVIVKPQEAQKESPAGIILPESAKKAPARGTVLKVGPGRLSDGGRTVMQVRKGDTVVYSKYAGTEIEENGQTVLILSESDILATVGA